MQKFQLVNNNKNYLFPLSLSKILPHLRNCNKFLYSSAPRLSTFSCFLTGMVTITSSQLRPLLLSTLVIACLLYLYAFPLNWSSGSTKSAHVDQSASSAEQVVVVSEPHPNLPDPSLPPAWHNTTRANAAFVILTRNKELDDVRWTMRQLEARFNHKFNYPYVFLNDEPFTEEFRELTSGMTNAKIQYGE